MWSVCSCFLNCSQLLSFFALSHTPWLGPWCLRKYLTAESGSLAALLCRGLCCLVECSVVLIAVGWTDEECVCGWVGGRMRCSATLPSSHIHLCLSPFQPPTYSFSPSWPTPPPILVAPWLQVSNTAPACFLWGEGGREGGSPVSRLTLAPVVLAGGQLLLAAVWEELTVLAEEKNLAGRWATWLWFILHSWNVAGGLGKALSASTESRDTHVQTSHSFYSKACLTGKILNLAFQDEENRPNCDFAAWVTHLISYWLHVGSLLLGWLGKIVFN